MPRAEPSPEPKHRERGDEKRRREEQNPCPSPEPQSRGLGPLPTWFSSHMLTPPPMPWGLAMPKSFWPHFSPLNPKTPSFQPPSCNNIPAPKHYTNQRSPCPKVLTGPRQNSPIRWTDRQMLSFSQHVPVQPSHYGAARSLAASYTHPGQSLPWHLIPGCVCMCFVGEGLWG